MRPPVRLTSCLILLLAGCQQAAPQSAALVPPAPLTFQVTELADLPYRSSTSYASGQAVDIGPLFDAEISLVGADMTNVRLDRMAVMSYTATCDDVVVPEQYRTKVIVYPDAVTEAVPTPTMLGYRLPLSTRTLMNLGLCNAQRPQTGTIMLHVEVVGPDRPRSSGDLLIRVSNGA